MRALLIGDIVGRPGRKALKELMGPLISKEKIDFVIANAENAAGGLGLTRKIAADLFSLRVDVLTSGNHIWKQKEIYDFVNSEARILRPANYPPDVPGKGWVLVESRTGVRAAVINLEGRVFMRSLDCPFRTADVLLEEIRSYTSVIFVDFHAEATSEKIALGRYLDGRISCLFGTHTHVQTADEKILPGGTGYITDIGMTGPHDSVIGRDIDNIIFHFKTELPVAFDIASGGVRLNGAIVEVDEDTGKAVSIRRVDEGLMDG
ncbi:MAG: TIGR00282 family metallophosphoesterase [Candidatus Omnitrophica bacterium]|nr:TIGR00282 family metallophosphoesterase [Candidatus Omnitrophota bacterium]